MHQVALQQSDMLRAQFMATISMYDPRMLIWLDESGSVFRECHCLITVSCAEARGILQSLSCHLMEFMMYTSPRAQLMERCS